MSFAIKVALHKQIHWNNFINKLLITSTITFSDVKNWQAAHICLHKSKEKIKKIKWKWSSFNEQRLPKTLIIQCTFGTHFGNNKYLFFVCIVKNIFKCKLLNIKKQIKFKEAHKKVI